MTHETDRLEGARNDDLGAGRIPAPSSTPRQPMLTEMDDPEVWARVTATYWGGIKEDFSTCLHLDLENPDHLEHLREIYRHFSLRPRPTEGARS